MITTLVGALVLQGAMFLVYLDRVTRRHSAQVDFLLQRIQDPVAAVAQHAMQATEYPVQHLPFNDDEAWLTYTEEMNGRSG